MWNTITGCLTSFWFAVKKDVYSRAREIFNPILTPVGIHFVCASFFPLYAPHLHFCKLLSMLRYDKSKKIKTIEKLETPHERENLGKKVKFWHKNQRTFKQRGRQLLKSPASMETMVITDILACQDPSEHHHKNYSVMLRASCFQTQIMYLKSLFLWKDNKGCFTQDSISTYCYRDTWC